MRGMIRRLGLRFDAVVIVVAGTNGKSSVAAMLEAIGIQAGYRVGSYTRPALVRLEESCRLHGEGLTADAWQAHVDAVEAARGDVRLTASAAASLAAARALAAVPLDLVVLEAGESADADPLALLDADCTVITSIDAEAAADRESVGTALAAWLRAGRAAVIADPMPPAGLLAYAQAIGTPLHISGRDFRFEGDRQQWSWAGRSKRFNALAYPALRGANQLLNAAAALAALELLRDRIPVSAQAVRNGLAMVELPGRFQIVPGQPTLVLDIASNAHAAAALLQNLDQMGFHPRTHAVFGAVGGVVRAAQVDAMLTRLAPVVDAWHFCDLPLADAMSADALRASFGRLALRGPGPVTVYGHPDPSSALAAAIAAADPADRIVAFGSHATVGGIFRNGVPRMPAPHAG